MSSDGASKLFILSCDSLRMKLTGLRACNRLDLPQVYFVNKKKLGKGKLGKGKAKCFVVHCISQTYYR